MQLRNVKIDFSEAQVHWTPSNPEFAQFWNGTSTFLPSLEPFLNRAVLAGKKRLGEGPEDAALAEDCRIFVGQETRHFKNHERFNALLHEHGYDELDALEKKMEDDYERFWGYGHRFCMAYAEGFETLGPIMATFVLEKAPEIMDPEMDDATADLWRWHLAEEYEHRTVCNYLFHRLYGGYAYRLYGIAFAGVHLFTYMVRSSSALIREDRRTGKIPDPWRSRWRYAKVLGRIVAHVVPRVLKSLAPSYDPADIPPPPRSMAVLEAAAAQYGTRA